MQRGRVSIQEIRRAEAAARQLMGQDPSLGIGVVSPGEEDAIVWLTVLDERAYRRLAQIGFQMLRLELGIRPLGR